MPTGEGNVQVTAVIPRELAARLDAFAKERHWSRSTAITVLIEGALPPAPTVGKRAGKRAGGQ